MTKKKKVSESCLLWVTTFDEESSIRFHSEAWQAFSEDPFNPLVIHIDSPGGDAYSLLSMWETMDNIRAVAPEEFYFITYVHGCALSCGLLLAAHGDLRVASPKSELMYHEVSDTPGTGREHQLDIHHANLKAFTNKIYEIFADDTNFKGGVKALRAWGEKDRWLTPPEAKKLGIIDVVGYVKPKQILTSVTGPSIGECAAMTLRKQGKKGSGKKEVSKAKPNNKK